MPRRKITTRLRSTKVNLWMRPDLLEKVNAKAEQLGLSRDGAVEQGMNLWISRKLGVE
jgi:hypothetical protein